MNWIEVGQVSYKTIVCYFFLLVVLKLMGKREIGKISTFDIVVFFVISELFSLSLNEPEHSILRSIIPVTIIVVLQIKSSKNEKVFFYFYLDAHGKSIMGARSREEARIER